MSAENAKTVMQLLSGKVLEPEQMKKIAEYYLADFKPVQNPYDKDDPDQLAAYNAWPTPNELGQMFLDRVRAEIRKHVRSSARIEAQAAVESKSQEVEDEL